MYYAVMMCLVMLWGRGRLGFELRDDESSGIIDAAVVNRDGDAQDGTPLGTPDDASEPLPTDDDASEPLPTDAGLAADGAVECGSFPPPSACATPPAPELDDQISAGACNLPPCSSEGLGLPAGDAYRYDMVTTRSNCGANVRLIEPFTAVGGRDSVVKTLHMVNGSCGFANDELLTRQTETFVGRYKVHCDVRRKVGGSTALELNVVEFDSPDHAVGRGPAYVRDVVTPCDFDFDIEVSRI